MGEAEARLGVRFTVKQRGGGQRFHSGAVAAIRHDDIRFGTLIIARPVPDADTLCAVLDRGFHVQVLEVHLFGRACRSLPAPAGAADLGWVGARLHELLELSGDGAEGGAKTAANQSKGADRCDRDQRCNQTVLDRRHTALVRKQLGQDLHG